MLSSAPAPAISTLQAIYSPIQTKSLYCELTNVRPQQIRGQITRNNVPTIKVGRFVMINVAKIQAALTHSPAFVPCPTMRPDLFAGYSGLDEQTIHDYLASNALPCYRHGRIKLVHVARLFEICLQEN